MKSSMIIHPDELSGAWIDKLADAGITTLGIHPVGGNTATESLTEMLALMKTDGYRRLIDHARVRGLSVEYEIHAGGYLMPRELFEEKPEYFRVDADGKRTNDKNFCVSNREALDLVAKRGKELALSLYGSSHTFNLWLDDGYDTRCHCPKCSSLSASDQQMLVLNEMLRSIRKHIPNAELSYLAYVDTVLPPSKILPDDGIFLEYAPFQKYTAKGEDAMSLIEREKDMIAPLMRIFSKAPCKVLEYWYDNSMLSEWKNPPKRFVLNEMDMTADIEEYRRMGFENIATFACYLGDDYKELYGEVDVSPFANAVTT